MKIRNGFVSNSSSSSFVMGIAVVDEEVAEIAGALLMDVYSVSSIFDGTINSYYIDSERINENEFEVSVSSFNGDVISVVVNREDIDKFIIYYHDSSESWNDEESYDSVRFDLFYFSESNIDLREFIDSQERSSSTFGAGYNG